MTVTYSVGYGTPPARLTLDQLNVRGDWAKCHPEFRRRLINLMDASDGKVGFGGGWRSSVQQRSLFLSRYVKSPVPTSVWWDGSYWKKKPGVASAAPSGASFHESTLDDFALAADMIGDLDWMGVHAVEHGLRDFSDVNSEPWHVQPSEIPTSRRIYELNPTRYPLHRPSPPIPPVPHPQPDPPPEDDMPRLMVIVGNDDNQSDPHRWLWDVNRLTLLLENETNEIGLIWPDVIDPRWTLQAPFWKPNEWIRTKVT